MPEEADAGVLTAAIATRQQREVISIPHLYLARHCKTQYNLEGRVQGTIDIPLSDVGRAEATANAVKIKSLGIERLVCSQQQRATETAQIYAEHLGVPVYSSPEFREMDLGVWEGRTRDDLLNDLTCQYGRWLEDPTSVTAPGSSEDVLAAQERIVGAFKDIVLKWPGETILIIAHKYVRSVLHCVLLDEPLTQFQRYIVEETKPVKIPSQQIQKMFGMGL